MVYTELFAHGLKTSWLGIKKYLYDVGLAQLDVPEEFLEQGLKLGIPESQIKELYALYNIYWTHTLGLESIIKRHQDLAKVFTGDYGFAEAIKDIASFNFKPPAALAAEQLGQNAASLLLALTSILTPLKVVTLTGSALTEAGIGAVYRKIEALQEAGADFSSFSRLLNSVKSNPSIIDEASKAATIYAAAHAPLTITTGAIGSAVSGRIAHQLITSQKAASLSSALARLGGISMVHVGLSALEEGVPEFFAYVMSGASVTEAAKQAELEMLGAVLTLGATAPFTTVSTIRNVLRGQAREVVDEIIKTSPSLTPQEFQQLASIKIAQQFKKEPPLDGLAAALAETSKPSHSPGEEGFVKLDSTRIIDLLPEIEQAGQLLRDNLVPTRLRKSDELTNQLNAPVYVMELDEQALADPIKEVAQQIGSKYNVIISAKSEGLNQIYPSYSIKFEQQNIQQAAKELESIVSSFKSANPAAVIEYVLLKPAKLNEVYTALNAQRAKGGVFVGKTVAAHSLLDFMAQTADKLDASKQLEQTLPPRLQEFVQDLRTTSNAVLASFGLKLPYQPAIRFIETQNPNQSAGTIVALYHDKHGWHLSAIDVPSKEYLTGRKLKSLLKTIYGHVPKVFYPLQFVINYHMQTGQPNIASAARSKITVKEITTPEAAQLFGIGDEIFSDIISAIHYFEYRPVSPAKALDIKHNAIDITKFSYHEMFVEYNKFLQSDPTFWPSTYAFVRDIIKSAVFQSEKAQWHRLSDFAKGAKFTLPGLTRRDVYTVSGFTSEGLCVIRNETTRSTHVLPASAVIKCETISGEVSTTLVDNEIIKQIQGAFEELSKLHHGIAIVCAGEVSAHHGMCSIKPPYLFSVNVYDPATDYRQIVRHEWTHYVLNSSSLGKLIKSEITRFIDQSQVFKKLVEEVSSQYGDKLSPLGIKEEALVRFVSELSSWGNITNELKRKIERILNDKTYVSKFYREQGFHDDAATSKYINLSLVDLARFVIEATSVSIDLADAISMSLSEEGSSEADYVTFRADFEDYASTSDDPAVINSVSITSRISDEITLENKLESGEINENQFNNYILTSRNLIARFIRSLLPKDVLLRMWDPQAYILKEAIDLYTAQQLRVARRYVSQLRSQIQAALRGDPQYSALWQTIPPWSRWFTTEYMLNRALTDVLHYARFLNVVGYDETGQPVFEPYCLRVGLLPIGQLAEPPTKDSTFVVEVKMPWSNEAKEMVAKISDIVEINGQKYYQLVTIIDPATQAMIYNDYAVKHSGLKWLLDMWIDPTLAGERFKEGPFSIPAFNRFALGLEYARTSRSQTAELLPAYVPDIAIEQSLLQSIGSEYLKSVFRYFNVRIPGRRYKSGSLYATLVEAEEEKEPAQEPALRDKVIVNLLDGYAIRLRQLIIEDMRRRYYLLLKERGRIIGAGEDVPPGYVELDKAFGELVTGIKRMLGQIEWSKMSLKLTSDWLNAVSQYQSMASWLGFKYKQLSAQNKRIIVPKSIIDIFINELANTESFLAALRGYEGIAKVIGFADRMRIGKILRSSFETLGNILQNTRAFMLLYPSTYIINYADNYIRMLALSSKFLFEGMIKGFVYNDWQESVKALYAAKAMFKTFLMSLPGFRYVFDTRFERLRQKLEAYVPDEYFETITATLALEPSERDRILSVASITDPAPSFKELLKILKTKAKDIGPMLLSAVGYGRIDVRAKQRLVLAYLGAVARAKGIDIDSLLDNIDQYQPELQRAIEYANRHLLNYANVPGIIKKLSRTPYGSLLVWFPSFKYSWLTREQRYILRALNEAHKYLSKRLRKQQLTKEEIDNFVDALTDFMMQGFVGIGGWSFVAGTLLSGVGSVLAMAGLSSPEPEEPEDDDPRLYVGALKRIVPVMDRAGNLRYVRRFFPRELSVPNRINISRIVEDYLNIDFKDKFDWWLYFKGWPILQGSAISYLARKDVAKYGLMEGLRTWINGQLELLVDILNFGPAIRIPAKIWADITSDDPIRAYSPLDPWATAVPLSAYLTSEVLSLIPGNRFAQFISQLLDPVRRRTAASTTLAYYPGVTEMMKIEGWTSVAYRLYKLATTGSAALDEIPPAGEISKRWRMVVNPRIYERWRSMLSLFAINLRPTDKASYLRILRSSKFWWWAIHNDPGAEALLEEIYSFLQRNIEEEQVNQPGLESLTRNNV